MSSSFYLTTPIYYVNDVPHIGHAYTTIAADVLARYARLQNRDTFFLTGLDEHGQKVQQAAEKANIDPQQHCDRLTPQFQNLWKTLEISHDAFIRTTDSQHKSIVQRALQQLYDKGLIYRAEYAGWYCTFDERFWTEKDITDGLCPDCHRPVERLSESNYFFRMGQFQQQLIDHIHSHPHFIKPESRRNEVLGFLNKPLEDLSISRPCSRLAWGIALPFDPQYVTYVWFDALMNYVSALEYLSPAKARAPYWPANLHIVGKDILTTHAVYWSTMLFAMALPLPHTIFAHGWWTVQGEKMSKSRGNVVDPEAMVKEFGTDAFRYFLLREVPFGQDGDFSREALAGRYTSDLANGLGNLLSRTVTLIQRFADGYVPKPEPSTQTELDHELQTTAETLISTTLPDYLSPERLELHRALEAIWGLIQIANQYIDKTAPWVLAKQPDNRHRLNTVLYQSTETLRLLCAVLYPFLPSTAKNMKQQLGIPLDFSIPLQEHDVTWGRLTPGTQVTKGNPLFPRIDTASRQKGEKSVEHSQDPISHEPTLTPPGSQDKTSDPQQITINEFQKVQLKVAKVIEAERVPKSEKLLKLQVQVGEEIRQIVAGIGKRYEPETLLGKTIVVVANLKPAKLMGIESQGMVLAAGGQEVMGLLTISDDVPSGTMIK
ncbi:MAG: methionine--tRNA ligase [Nitrospirales bacterium]|nr:methionine--tRNA ligase [Nitrospirales bacterium]